MRDGRVREELRPDYTPYDLPDFDGERERQSLHALAREIERRAESPEVAEELKREALDKDAARSLADTGDGLIEYVRWGPIGRLGLLRNLHTLYDGSHLNHPLASRRAVRRVDFYLDGPVDVMVDGEVLTLHCQTIEVLPAALNVMV